MTYGNEPENGDRNVDGEAVPVQTQLKHMSIVDWQTSLSPMLITLCPYKMTKGIIAIINPRMLCSAATLLIN
jgi:hypothetical protein